ncbi:hypothetical protein T190607A01A_11343 [Tenacibaculum sp. 190524A05c]|uniref:Uncharacterized protein n=1 Tax=Tenacibaculum platacis TaxID=3137852 RepID=A0ABM9NXK6_9FLAO
MFFLNPYTKQNEKKYVKIDFREGFYKRNNNQVLHIFIIMNEKLGL